METKREKHNVHISRHYVFNVFPQIINNRNNTHAIKNRRNAIHEQKITIYEQQARTKKNKQCREHWTCQSLKMTDAGVGIGMEILRNHRKSCEIKENPIISNGFRP